MNTVFETLAIAVASHKLQLYGDLPYVNHLIHVANEVSALTDDPDVIAAAILHDILEDTETTAQDLRDNGVSEDTITIVQFLTDPKGFKTRKERKAIIYEKILDAKAAEHPLIEKACLVKRTDRYCNRVCGVAEHSRRHIEMYIEEHEEFIRVYGTDDNLDAIHEHALEWISWEDWNVND